MFFLMKDDVVVSFEEGRHNNVRVIETRANVVIENEWLERIEARDMWRYYVVNGFERIDSDEQFAPRLPTKPPCVVSMGTEITSLSKHPFGGVCGKQPTHTDETG